MSTLISLFIIGVSLSMDTFSISLSISTVYIPKRKIIELCILVGLFHFLLPLFGNYLGNKIITLLQVNVNLLLGIILIFIAIEMLIDLIKKEEKIFSLNFISILLISLSVSLDSFSTGLGLSAITNSYILSGLIFCIFSASFTFLGYLIGKYSNKKLGIYANILGILMLFFLGIVHILK